MKNPYSTFLEDYLIENHHLSTYDLKKTFHCLNPDHTDEHPSMHLSKNKTYCHCFACGKTYDIVSLVMQDKSCSYKEAIDFLHEKYNDKINDVDYLKKYEEKYSYKNRNVPTKLNNYEIDKKASDYLKSRGIKYADDICNVLRLKIRDNQLYIPHIHLNENNEFVSTDYIIRNLNPNADTRYIRQAGVNSTTYSFPYDNLSKNSLFKSEYEKAMFEVQFVTEGEIDMASLFDLRKDYKTSKSNVSYAYTALSSTGNINKYIDLINEIDPKRKPKTLFILCLDNDNAGRQTSDVLKGFLLENNLLFYDASNIYSKYKDINEAIQKDRTSTQQSFNELTDKIEDIYYKEKGKLYLSNYIENGKIIEENHSLIIPFLHCTTFRLNKNKKPCHESKDSLDIRVLFNPNDSINTQFNDLLTLAKEKQKEIMEENNNDVCFYLNTGTYRINKNETNNIADLMGFLVSKKVFINETEYPLDGYAEFSNMNDGYHYLEVTDSNLNKIFMQSLNSTRYKEKIIIEELGTEYSQIQIIKMDKDLWKKKEQERDFE